MLLDFASSALDYAKGAVFHRYQEEFRSLGTITTGFLGTVDDQGNLRLYDGRLRLMHPDGTCVEFPASEYTDFLAEQVEPWSSAKMVFAKSWGEGFSLEPDAPKGVYRVNTLARLNVCDRIATPRAQAELEEFRRQFGRPAQGTLLYHWARLIELIYACERVLELLADDRITDPAVRTPVHAKGRPGYRPCRGTARHLDPRLQHRRERLHYPGQPDCRHHPQYRADEPECASSRRQFNQQRPSG